MQIITFSMCFLSPSLRCTFALWESWPSPKTTGGGRNLFLEATSCWKNTTIQSFFSFLLVDYPVTGSQFPRKIALSCFSWPQLSPPILHRRQKFIRHPWTEARNSDMESSVSHCSFWNTPSPLSWITGTSFGNENQQTSTSLEEAAAWVAVH